MPPKPHSPPADSGRTQPERKSKKDKSFPAQTLEEMNCHRARKIASSLKIKDYAKVSWPSQLMPLIKEAMAKNQACTVCGGGACIPDTHRFPATNPYVEVDELGNPVTYSSPEESPPRGAPGNVSHAMAALAATEQPHDQVVSLS